MSTKQYAERDAMALDEAGGYYCRHVSAMAVEHLHSKSDIAAELGWRDMQIARLNDQLRVLAAENADLKESRAVLAENSLETCNVIYCAGYRNDDTQRGLMQSTGNGNKYPNPIKSLVDEALRQLETPATDAILNEVRAQGAEQAIDEAIDAMVRSGAQTFGDCVVAVNSIRDGEVPNV